MKRRNMPGMRKVSYYTMAVVVITGLMLAVNFVFFFDNRDSISFKTASICEGRSGYE